MINTCTASIITSNSMTAFDDVSVWIKKLLLEFCIDAYCFSVLLGSKIGDRFCKQKHHYHQQHK